MIVIKAIIPAYNEEETIAHAIKELLSHNTSDLKISEVIVCDNNSKDQTAKIAEQAGAKVVKETRQGYGAACLKAIAVSGESDLLVFMDADGSDYPEEWVKIVSELVNKDLDLVIGSRTLIANDGLLFHQRFGNKLASFFLSLKYKQKFTDLGPFRAIRTKVLRDLDMQDQNYGWTIEMQIKALKRGYKVGEVPVNYRQRQGGESKISGNIKGSFLAGKIILQYIIKDLWQRN